ncbi:uncharacterized protein LOC129914315 isoform X2 [Episyrphus balteatus]|uniref:uncharacterized protein LOC129914315 isoform X2 n=1 Tax=Episyrphus balteatus TaxID=286459 RepID=UPI002484ECDF|nr:uncharacterized protein LOC129914315 isoform X2 [Episyrphus balteatus]
MQSVDYYFEETQKMHGVKRVIVFCILIVILPTILIIIPLYLRKSVFADVTYPVAESDIIEIRDGISSIFCQQHTLRMSTHFNAFQLHSKPEISTNRKHIRLKKSMTLPDDTLEYWGFYLLKGAKVYLRFCSRYDGSRILVVRGEKTLKTCGVLEHNKNKVGTNLAHGHEQVRVFFEDTLEIKNASSVNLDELENHGGEISDDDTTTTTTRNPITTSRSRSRKLRKPTRNKTDEIPDTESEEQITRSPRARRHHEEEFQKRHATEYERKKQQVYDQLYKHREKRDHVYDRKYVHGGNALNYTENESNSISSFENSLFDCYNGNILLAEGFPPSNLCTSVHFLETGSHRMMSKHEITEDGYYYYIFYSDNDLVRNDIHAIFDIYKPTFQYSNSTDNSSGCVNSTNCTFPITFLSNEIVVVEVPTRDGIEHEEDDITYLVSTCHPRMEIYAIFPIAVLVLILSCSFL